MLMLFIGVSAYADTYVAYQYAFKVKNNYEWTSWSDWYDCYVYMSVSNDNTIVIYTKDEQVYYPYYAKEEYVDNDGGTNQPYLCKDKNGLNCEVRLRAEKNGAIQIYITYSDIMWVYCFKSMR